MYNRILNPLLNNSFFLFGARGTGKTTFLKNLFPEENTIWFDLLDLELEDEFQRNPKSLFQQVLAEQNRREIEWIVIDEVQKIPKLLNMVHQYIENSNLKFALTGSSARKLKKGAANLLAGRAFINNLYSLSFLEMGEDFNLELTLNWGLLPKISQFATDLERAEYLRAYGLTYLKEEVWGEQLVKNLDPFRNFLEISAQANTEVINFTNIGKDVGVDVKTVQSYFEILQDTLLGFYLEPYHKSIRKQQRQSPKFYYFDLGIVNALSRRLSSRITPNTYGFGKAFEHFIITEIYKLNDYYRKEYRLSYLRTKDGAEIDLIIEKPSGQTLLIEIKSAETVDERDTKTIQQFIKDFQNAQGLVISRDPNAKQLGNVLALPWQQAVRQVFELEAIEEN